jgi:multiple sugar transport system ATP-binding protein
MAEAKTVRKSIDDRVQSTAKKLEIDHLLLRRPKELSGGQRQRVALGRAIVRNPKVFLMDEPLSNLDAKLRIQTRAELIRLHRELQVTTIYVTHDQVEAMTMGQRIAVMKDGLLQQCDEPETVYHKPANKFVAGFIGSPPMNFMDAVLKEEAGKLLVDAGSFRLPVSGNEAAKAYAGKAVTLGIRPEAIFDVELNNPIQNTPENTFEAQVDVLEPLGPTFTITLLSGDHTMHASIDSATKIKERTQHKFCVNLDAIHLFDAESGIAIR